MLMENYCPMDQHQSNQAIHVVQPTPNKVAQQNGHGPQAGDCHSSHSNVLSRVRSLDTCRVCGDGPARMHYGVPTCFGCKGFFRRTLKRTKEYTCRYSGSCIVDRYERNSCRFCRFKRCLEVGMDPKAVRPDRDAAGRTHPVRRRISRNHLLGQANGPNGAGGEVAAMLRSASEPELIDASGTDEWVRKLPVEMRTLLMQIMNMEAMVHHGDTHECPQRLYPLPFQSLGQIFEDPTCLDGKRTEIRYEPYRQVEPEELTYLAHRRLIATVDTVDHLCALMDLHSTRDKMILAKAAYAPLTLFCAVAATARVTRSRDILCLCNYGFVPRGAHLSYAEPYHFANRLVDRALDELVEPFRTFNFKEQEIVLMKAIVALNPYLPSLSTEAAEQVADFRDRVQETLYNVVRESHPKEVASSRFGNLLLFLPNIMILGSIMMENLQFIQSFRHQEIGPLLNELLEDMEPVQDHGISIDDVLSLSSSENDQSLRHSQSSSSICSMANGQTLLVTAAAGAGGGQQSQSCHNLAYQPHPQKRDFVGTDNFRGSVPNLNSQQGSSTKLVRSQMSSNDSDPDYNVTLTAESLRQHQPVMEVDSPAEGGMPMAAASSPPLPMPGQKPHFFIDPSASGTCFQPPPQPISSAPNTGGGPMEQQLKTTVASSKHIFTVEKSGMAPCCRERSGTGVGGKCRNEECPAALAAIFQQQQQQQRLLLRQQFEENVGNFMESVDQQQTQHGLAATMGKSQSFPHFDTASFPAPTSMAAVDPSSSTNFAAGIPMPMPYSSLSYDHFQQQQ